MHTMSHAASAHPSLDQRVLWFGLFGAPLVWSVQELVSYVLSAYECNPPGMRASVPRLPGLWTWQLVVGLAALVVAAVAAWTAIRTWRAARLGYESAEHHQLEVGEGRVGFMAFAGILLSGVFLLGIVMNLISIFVLPPCK
jgi:hypothetical protein